MKLTALPFVLLATLTFGCSDDKTCSVAEASDGSTTITCDDGTSAIVDDADQTCSVTDNGDGTATITCDDGTSTTVGNDDSCTVTDNGDGTATIACDDGTSTTVGSDDSCTVTDNGDGTATITCDDGTATTVGTDESCTTSSNGDGTGSFSCPDGSQAEFSCTAIPHAGGSCISAGTLDCAILDDGNLSANTRIFCDNGPYPECGDDVGGVIANATITFDFGADVEVAGVRFVSDWFTKRPVNYDVWYSASPSDLPGAGATMVAATTAASAPHRCATSEACDYWTPDGCCPDGRDDPQDTINIGLFQAKYDILEFAPASARYWHLRVIDSADDDYLIMREVEFLDTACSLTLP